MKKCIYVDCGIIQFGEFISDKECGVNTDLLLFNDVLFFENRLFIIC